MSELIQVTLSPVAGVRDVHVRACVDGTDDSGELARADVLYFARPVTESQLAAQLAAYPGCMICAGVAAHGTLIFAVRSAQGGDGVSRVASVIHALLAWGLVAQAGTDS